jgi:predicted membrane channel-forming protein YqfA (hemolysin III family)
LQCPLLLIAAALAYWLVPNRANEETEASASDKFARIDFAGATSLAATITSFMLAVELAGQKFRWNHPIIIILALLSIGFGVVFAITEKYFAVEPVFPLELLGNFQVVASYMVLLLQIAAQLGV